MRKTQEEPVVIIGAGIGGLAAALVLALRGVQVEVFESGAGPGGKLQPVKVGGTAFDGGPTVLTMRWVFDDLLSGCGARLDDVLGLSRSRLLARHFWSGGAQLDLFADAGETAAGIETFAGSRDADGYRRFVRDSAAIFDTLRSTYIDAPCPTPLSLASRIGWQRPGAMLALKPFASLWAALGGYFSDPRLRQLFGRYATYCGSSPFAAPATLMLVAHAERSGVWLVEGGMRALAAMLAGLCEQHGVAFHFNEPVTQILASPADRAVAGVVTGKDRMVPARRVIHNGDEAALAALLDHRRRGEARPFAKRSLSALVACAVARPQGLPLAHHNVFFGDDYAAEFDAIFARRAAPADPTVYLCAQDRDDLGNPRDAARPDGERIYMLMNMPADGDRKIYPESERERCMTAMERRLAAGGLTLRHGLLPATVRAPDDFARAWPGSGGALYGMATHGWTASFSRRGARGPISGLYLAGGSVHPGPGVPMAALSGKLAAKALLADAGLTEMSRPADTGGTISTASAIAGNMRSR
ncbi:1-hydroxycarotenoid 3,4-desaturase CrtD [Zhengella sp. ZM62]|uniref:1-hydroxycarotenoid 3,4-desaturase CrtD n=1 Tax=Zhengella sedimenti TaxID=3390035 RepID=UPI0039761B28